MKDFVLIKYLFSYGRFLLMADFDAYVKCQERVSETFQVRLNSGVIYVKIYMCTASPAKIIITIVFFSVWLVVQFKLKFNRKTMEIVGPICIKMIRFQVVLGDTLFKGQCTTLFFIKYKSLSQDLFSFYLFYFILLRQINPHTVHVSASQKKRYRNRLPNEKVK